MNLADRAKAIGQRQRPDEPRDAWHVTKANGETVLVLFSPPQTLAGLRANFYPDCATATPA